MRAPLLLSFLLLALGLGCRDYDDRAGSSGLAKGPKVSAAGIWKGEWASLVGSGDVGQVMYIVDEDADGNLNGCSCWTGSACWDDGLFSGLLVDARLENPAVMELLRSPPGSDPRFKATVVTATLDIIGDQMTGSYEVRRDDDRRCTDLIARKGDEGTTELVRTDREGDFDTIGICDRIAVLANCFDDPIFPD